MSSFSLSLYHSLAPSHRPRRSYHPRERAHSEAISTWLIPEDGSQRLERLLDGSHVQSMGPLVGLHELTVPRNNLHLRRPCGQVEGVNVLSKPIDPADLSAIVAVADA